MIAAASARQRVVRARPTAQARELPSLADAVLAFTALSESEVVLVVTDDTDDFWQLAPAFGGSVETIHSVLLRIGL